MNLSVHCPFLGIAKILVRGSGEGVWLREPDALSAECMLYVGVKCETCKEVFALKNVTLAFKEIGCGKPSFKASCTSPHCNAHHKYTEDDLVFYGGDATPPRQVGMASICRGVRRHKDRDDQVRGR